MPLEYQTGQHESTCVRANRSGQAIAKEAKEAKDQEETPQRCPLARSPDSSGHADYRDLKLDDRIAISLDRSSDHGIHAAG